MCRKIKVKVSKDGDQGEQSGAAKTNKLWKADHIQCRRALQLIEANRNLAAFSHCGALHWLLLAHCVLPLSPAVSTGRLCPGAIGMLARGT